MTQSCLEAGTISAKDLERRRNSTSEQAATRAGTLADLDRGIGVDNPRVPRITQQLRDEHYELLWRVESLRLLGDAVADPPAVWLPDFDDVLTFLRGQVLVHARAQDYGLYPVVAVLFGGLRATATMTREHRQIVQLIKEFAAIRGCLENTGVSPDPDVIQRLQWLAYGLHALIQTHLEKEILLYLPVLDERLTSDRAGDMFRAMARAAARAHDQLRDDAPTNRDTP